MLDSAFLVLGVAGFISYCFPIIIPLPSTRRQEHRVLHSMLSNTTHYVYAVMSRSCEPRRVMVCAAHGLPLLAWSPYTVRSGHHGWLQHTRTSPLQPHGSKCIALQA
jgi:hypothetical protein